MARPGNQGQLAMRSGLSTATVSTAVSDLEKIGWVRTTSAGRRVDVQMAPAAGAVVGVELGYHASAVVARRAHDPFDQAQKKPLRDTGAIRREWPREIARGVQEAVDDLGEEEVAAIGLAVPRVVNPRTGGLEAPFLQPWEPGDNPAEWLMDALRGMGGRPRVAPDKVLIDNDANLTALAESVYEYPETETLVAIKASTGIGAGIMVGGKLFRGRDGVAGEIGHIVAQPGGRFCTCGGRGCLETLVGADALIDQARTVLGNRRLLVPQSLDNLVEMARGGNVTCRRVLEEASETLGFAIGNLCNVLNPDVVVLSGGLGRAWEYTIEPCRSAIRRSAMRAVADRPPTLVASKLEHAAAHGALVLAIQGTSYGR
jgi:predicted NBD/HSP70 family sugar kinase